MPCLKLAFSQVLDSSNPSFPPNYRRSPCQASTQADGHGPPTSTPNGASMQFLKQVTDRTSCNSRKARRRRTARGTLTTLSPLLYKLEAERASVSTKISRHRMSFGPSYMTPRSLRTLTCQSTISSSNLAGTSCVVGPFPSSAPFR